MASLNWFLWVAFPAKAGGILPCGTPQRFDEFLGVTPKEMPLRPPQASKGIRDSMPGVCSGQMTSENFVLKWGSAQAPATSEMEQVMAALETSWQHQLNVMEHAHPDGSDAYLFNVYVGDSGGCAPSAQGMGGYYTRDADGWPFIVLSQGVFSNPEYGQTTVAHEFYHAVQDAEDSYARGSDVRWWWEATAMWVEGEVYPATENYYSFLYGYAFQPQRQLNAYKYPETGALEEYHQYGAAIWPRYLTENIADWQIIRNSWSMADENSDPVELMRADLESEFGLDLDVVFGDFAAHNATWDYEHGDNIVSYLDYIAESTEYEDNREVEYVRCTGTGSGLQSPPEATLPQRYGYNLIRHADPPKGGVTFRFQGDQSGSDGSDVNWQVRVVKKMASRSRYTTMDLDELKSGEVRISTKGTEENLFLVVAAISPDWNEGETFDYAYEIEVDGDCPEPTTSTSKPQAFNPEEKGGCSHIGFN